MISWPLSQSVTPTKRRASHSPQGELQPAPVMAKTDHPIEPDMRTVLSQLDMPIPEDAIVDAETDGDTVNMQVRNSLAGDLHGLKSLERAIRHAKIDEESCSDAIDELASALLPAIFDHSKNDDDDRVFSYKDIIKRNPWLINELIRAHKYKKYHVIRQFRVFPSLPKREARQEIPQHTSKENRATVSSWDAEFVGNIPTILRGILRHHMATKNPRLYRVVSHVQSSGTGKSRAHDELAKSIFYIPLNLAAPGTTTYPPRDPKVGEWFDVSQNYEQQRTRDRCHAFLHALLSTTLFRLKNICDDKAVAHKIEIEPQSRLMILASEFRNKMAEGRVFEQHGEYRRNFYDEVYCDAKENVNLSTSSITIADLPSSDRSPKHKFPVRTRGSDGRDSMEQPDENYDNKQPAKSRRVGNQLTTAEVAREIILLLNPERKSNDSPQVVISWDESHSLLQPIGKAKWTRFSELRRALRTIKEEPVISVFLSTVGNFEDFSPATEYDPSMRLSDGDLESLPPITEVSFDQFAEKVDCIKETWMLARIASTHQMAHLGRALFPTRFDNGDFDVKKSIVAFAAEKLLCRPPFRKGLQFDEPDESLACLAVRLGLDFKDTSWLDKVVECRQVERHMRICLAATAGFRSMVTISPSEPLLAEASWMLMSRGLGPKEAPQALLKHIDESYLNAGDRGEVVAALLLMLARDEAIHIRKQDRKSNPGGELPKGVSSEDLKYDGVAQGRIVTMLEFIDALVPPKSRLGVRRQKPHYWSENHLQEKSLESAFTKAHIYFNHFIKVHDSKMVERKYLWRLICRGAAIICANNQRGVDIIIPVLMGTVLHPKFVTAIFVQVKNDRSYTDDVSDSLFTGMDPCKVKLFTENGKPPRPPVLRIVLALASEKSAVTGPTFGTRSSPCIQKEVDFTAYDLWISGVSSKSFGVIPDTNTQEQYRLLLDRTRNVFNGYDMLIKFWSIKEKEVIIESRRMLHAGASSGDGHFQNYIDNENLKTIPTTGYNNWEFYVEEPTNSSDDVVMGEEGTLYTCTVNTMGVS